MEYSTTSPPTLHRRSLQHELQIGRRAAEQLRRRLIRSPDTPLMHHPATSDFDLAQAIFNSFANSIAIVNNVDPASIHSGLGLDDCKIEESGDGGGESSRTKDRRGCYKRRKRGQSCTVEGEAAAEDTYAWRKYGQKSILNHKFPRNYYRCTHKIDQGCPAIKQVQRLSQSPTLYRTTYSGDHTCKTPLKPAHLTLPSSSSDHSDSSILLSFDRSATSINNPFFPPPSSIKHETHRNNNNNNVSQAMMMMGMSQSPVSDYNNSGGDVISAGTYPASPSSFEFDDIFSAFEGQDHLDLIEFN